jgi:hypothetical protein
VSYGGSSLVVSLAAVGVLVSIARSPSSGPPSPKARGRTGPASGGRTRQGASR